MIAFDAVAEDYDRREADNPIMQMMRTRSLAVLESTFPNGSALLDVGCGTGTEALWLARRGRTVFGVDSSSQMLEVLARRAAAANLQVSTQLMRAGDLARLADTLGEASFDGAYSSFGALNTEPALGPPVAALSRLVRPGGRIVLGVMNRWCIAEIALHAARGRTKQAFRRTLSSVRVSVGSQIAEVQYPSWRQLARVLRPGFRIVTVQALPFLLVPYAWPALSAHPRVYKAVSNFDQVLAPRRPFAWLGDHLLVVAERS
ncbi:MAG: class I SAM-dependent methyltransferase [Candidatus Dormibacteraceae bacterium]